MKWDREVYNKLHDAEYTLGFIRWSVTNDEVYNLGVKAEMYLDTAISLIKDAQKVIKENDRRKF